VVIVKADVSETEEHTKRFGIKNIPTCILLENNEELGRFIGVKTPDQIKNFIQEHQN
jgi:thioredoxin-like negative regulator of GroEL